MNNIYLFYVLGVKPAYIVASTWKEARNYAHKQIFRDILKLPDIKGVLIRKNCSECKGQIDINTLCKKYAWWQCSCGGNSFIALDANDSCRCTLCGKERTIPPHKKSKPV